MPNSFAKSKVNFQSGFAIIPLLILIVLGIAAGVYLTQTGTSFLPKAQEINDTDCYLSNTINFQGEPVSKISYGNTGKGYVCSKSEAFIYGCLEKGLEIFRLPYYDPICKGLEKGRVETERCENNTAIHADGSITDCGGNGLVCVTGIGAKGDSGKIKYAQSNSSQVLGLATSRGPNYAYCSGTYCTNNNRYVSDGNKYIESCKYNQQCLSITYTGASPSINPFIWSTDVTVCKDKKSPTGSIIECGFNDVDHDKAIFSHCDFTHNGDSRSEDLTFCRAQSRRDYERFKLWCTKTQSQPAQEAAAQPAANPNPESQPTSEAGGCTKPEAESCKGICYKDTSGKKQCTASKENSSGCSEAQQKLCTDKKRNSGCMIIRGEVKCLYSEGAKCDSDDSNACSQGCAVVQREGQWVSECKATVCSQGYHNFCMATKNKSCEIKDGVPDCTGDPSKAPKPAAAAVTAPRSGAGAPAAGNQPQSPQQAATANTPKPPAAPLICGKDENLNDIPCYAMGVFSNEELKTREAQAKIASVNYTLFRQILDNEAKEIDAKVKENARAKIAAAEEAMKACLK